MNARPLAVIDPAASARMAVTEAVTNIAAAPVEKLGDIKLSANWMAAAGQPGEDADLYAAVRAVGEELCPALGIAIPVGKDSLSMKTVWQRGHAEQTMLAPLSLIVSAFAPVRDARQSLTPQLRSEADTRLLLVDLGGRRNRLGGSALAQVYGHIGDESPDLDDPERLKGFFGALQTLRAEGKILAYHDRSDGGLLTTLCEMAFAGHCGVELALDALSPDTLAELFCEEPGAVIQARERDVARVRDEFSARGIGDLVLEIGTVTGDDAFRISRNEETILERTRTELHRIWSETSFRIQALRDNPECAHAEFDAISDAGDPGLSPRLCFDPAEDIAAPYINKGERPRVAILREQGVNGQVEMAAAFDRAGFDAIDVHMTDLIDGRVRLDAFHGMVACGGFSYGDVLGGGEGWAKSVLFHPQTRDQFATFLSDTTRFSLGVCNGCQMFANLRELIPGAAGWPHFVRNASEQFEARVSLMEISESPSLFFNGMAGSRIPVAVAHGEGRAEYHQAEPPNDGPETGFVCARFVDNAGHVTERYPSNPNGSPLGITGLTNGDGRVTILMPHPERVFRSVQYSWCPEEWGEDGPWMRMFRNARCWLE